MARLGQFDPELVAVAWFDPTVDVQGWVDREFIPAPGIAPPAGGFTYFGFDENGQIKPKRLRDTRPLFWRETRRAAFRAALKRAGMLDGVAEPEAKVDGSLLERVVALRKAGEAAEAAQATAASVQTPERPDAQPVADAAPAPAVAAPMPEIAVAAPWVPETAPELPVAVAVFPPLPRVRADKALRERFARLVPLWRFVPKPSQESEPSVEIPSVPIVPKLSQPPQIVTIDRVVERIVDREVRVEVPGPERVVRVRVPFERHAARQPPRPEVVEHHAARFDAPKVITRRVQRADPVHPVMTGGKVVGYQWGSHGKVYKTKEKAQEQARAIYAAGYRGDSRARGILANVLKANRAAELHYTRDVVALFKGVHRGIMGMVDKEILPEAETRQNRLDAREAVRKANELLNARLNKRIAKHLRDRAGPMWDLMAKRVSPTRTNRGCR